MARDIRRILISTMPRSGTVYFFDFMSRLYGFEKKEPTFTGGTPVPPEWDPYKFDETYLSLRDGDVLCAHYPLTDGLRAVTQAEDLLCIYLYRDPRDAAVSAALYIRHALAHHPLHEFFQNISEADCITFILTGGIVRSREKNSYILHEGMRYFCATARQWLACRHVAHIRYEDFMVDPVTTLTRVLVGVDVVVDPQSVRKVAGELTFAGMAGGRLPGQEQKDAHFRKGVRGDYANYFTETQTAVCKLMIGDFLIEQGYEQDHFW